METFGRLFSLLIPFGTLAVIIFSIAAIMEGKSNMKKANIIRSLYFYLASVITLVIVVGSVIYLANLGLKTWVFTGADQGIPARLGAPPTLYLAEEAGSEVKPVAGMGSLVCDEDCSLTESQKNAIATWRESYQAWLEANDNPGSQRARDAVIALSFLIVALPFYIIHFRIVQRESRSQGDNERSVIRPTYFYFIALGSLVMMVIAGGFLINLALKTWVFPSAGEADKVQERIAFSPVAVSSEGEAVKSLATCGEKCGLDQTTVVLAARWPTDYEAWQKEISRSSNNTQRQAATAIPFVLVGIPLFGYHWSVVRKESREKKEEQQPLPRA